MTRHASVPRYTLVIVSQDLDQPFLEMQAKSLRLYLDPDPAFIDRIFVIDNSDVGSIRIDSLAGHLGLLAGRLVFLSRADAGLQSMANGWIRQQALKILAARWVRTHRYLVLDAKNHLVNRWSLQHVETSDSLHMRSHLHGYGNHPLRLHIVNAIRYFALAPSLLDNFMPSSTPYTFSTGLVRQMLRYIERRENKAFGPWFCADHRGMTEFATYATFLRFTGLEFAAVYHLQNRPSPLIWRSTSPTQFGEALGEAKTQPVFGVHRGAFRRLDTGMRRDLAVLWRSRSLFDTEAEALAFIEACAFHYR